MTPDTIHVLGFIFDTIEFALITIIFLTMKMR